MNVFDDDYKDVAHVLFPSRENVSKKETKTDFYAIRDIQSVPDYLRAITDILSNRYIIDLDDKKINNFENAFTLSHGIRLKDLLKQGIFFRGESALYQYQLAGLFRNIEYVEHENDLINETTASSAKELENKSLFDKLTIMQHYGSPTRILDITSNALIALYFAVSSNVNEDGYVYLLTGYKGRNFKDENIKVNNPNDKEVIVKSVIGELTFEQKKILSEYFDQYRDNSSDIKSKLNKITIADNKKLNKIKEIIDKLYMLVEKEMKTNNIKIPICYMFGMNIVKPYSIDPRIEHQSSAFIIFGLEKLYESKELTKGKIDKDAKLKELNKKYNEAHEEAEKQGNIKIGGPVFQLESKIKKRKEEIFKDCYTNLIQQDINHQIYKLSIRYAPTFGDKSEGQARIKIKSKYKKQILDELIMEGINGSTVYPDITHKINNIKEENNYLDFNEEDY